MLSSLSAASPLAALLSLSILNVCELNWDFIVLFFAADDLAGFDGAGAAITSTDSFFLKESFFSLLLFLLAAPSKSTEQGGSAGT
jgi:hypothetical protein